MKATSNDRRISDTGLAAQGLRLNREQEKREILRRQIEENEHKGRVRVYDFRRRRFRVMEPSDAMALCIAGEGSVANRRGTRNASLGLTQHFDPQRIEDVAVNLLILVSERRRFPFDCTSGIRLFQSRFPELPRPRVGEIHFACKLLCAAGYIRSTPKGWFYVSQGVRSPDDPPENAL